MFRWQSGGGRESCQGTPTSRIHVSDPQSYIKVAGSYSSDFILGSFGDAICFEGNGVLARSLSFNNVAVGHCRYSDITLPETDVHGQDRTYI